jgi:small-conductance mechanosensitive channel
MSHDLSFIWRNLLDPATLPGAALYAVAFAAAAWLAGRLIHLAVKRALDSHVPQADPTVVNFLGQLARLGIYVIAILSYASHIPVLRQLGGVWLTSVGVVSVVVGIAAQSTLGNLISGVALLLYRPFSLGDRLQVNCPTGVESGVVESLSLGYTTLQTADNRRIIIPNSVMASQTCVNISRKDQHAMCVLTLTLANTADIAKAREILEELARANPRVSEVAGCRVNALSDSGTTIALTAWCADANIAAEVKSELLETVKRRFDADGIAIAH